MTVTSVPGLNVVCVNGPVPSVSVTPKSSPSSSRLRRFTGMEFSVASVSGNAVNGFFMVTTTVVGSSPALASATDGQKIAFWPFFGSRMMLKFSAIIAASSAAPLWNLRSGRSLKVHVRRSSEISQDSNSDGVMPPCASRIIGNS